MIDRSLLVCAVLSVAAHFALGEALSTLPPRAPIERDRRIEITVVTPPPPTTLEPEPPPPPPPAPEPPPPPPVAKPVPTTKPAPAKPTPPLPTQPQIAAAAPAETAAPNAAVGTADAPAQPVFGVTMESTSTGGSGPAVPVGNTTTPQAGEKASGGGPAKQMAPAAAAEVTKMPLPQGACSGKYTDDARAAGIEGTVVLDLVVDESGRARDITVVSGLDHGLTEAAVAALKACRFSPGERSGQRVPVRVRGFKIRFVMADGQ